MTNLAAKVVDGTARLDRLCIGYAKRWGKSKRLFGRLGHGDSPCVIAEIVPVLFHRHHLTRWQAVRCAYSGLLCAWLCRGGFYQKIISFLPLKKGGARIAALFYPL